MSTSRSEELGAGQVLIDESNQELAGMSVGEPNGGKIEARLAYLVFVASSQIPPRFERSGSVQDCKSLVKSG